MKKSHSHVSNNIQRNILLNPGPATTSDTVKYAQVVPDICPREEEFGALVLWIQEQLCTFVGTKENTQCVLVGGSGTAAVEMVISSVIPQNSALIVINNGAYAERIIKIASIYHIEVIDFPSPTDKEVDYTALEECIVHNKKLLAQKNKTLSHMAAIHHETTSGLLNNMKKLGSICNTHAISLISDAMSSFAAIPIDMESDNIEYVIASSNKNLQGMAGIGIALCNTDALENTKTIEKRNLYLNLYDQYSYFLKTRQFRFTPPVQTLYAMKQAIQECITEGVENRYTRYLNSYQILRQGMQSLGFRVLVPEEISSGLITTFFEPEDTKYNFDTMHDYLYEKGFTIYPGKISQAHTFRLANIGDIYKEDIHNFLHCLKQYLQTYNIKV